MGGGEALVVDRTGMVLVGKLDLRSLAKGLWWGECSMDVMMRVSGTIRGQRRVSRFLGTCVGREVSV